MQSDQYRTFVQSPMNVHCSGCVMGSNAVNCCDPMLTNIYVGLKHHLKHLNGRRHRQAIKHFLIGIQALLQITNRLDATDSKNCIC